MTIATGGQVTFATNPAGIQELIQSNQIQL